MTKFTIINLIRKNITKAQDGFWTVKGKDTHRTVTNIVKLSSGEYATTHNLKHFSSFMAAVASLVSLFGYRKPVNAVFGLVLAAISAAAVLPTMAHADEMSQLDVMTAETDLQESVTKFALLTHSLSPQGQKFPELVGVQLTNEITSAATQGIADALSAGHDCSEINSKYAPYITDGMEQSIKSHDTKLSPVAEKSFKKMKSNITAYIAAQCKNLSE